MARPDRLFRLLAALRMLPQPVTAAQLAAATGVSGRQLYRDIASLRAGGAVINGAAGVGYALIDAPALPAQMFTLPEVEALMLGLAAVHPAADPVLADAVRTAQAKIVASLPEAAQRQVIHAEQQTRSLVPHAPAPPLLGLVRQAAWDEAEVRITYRDHDGAQTSRSIWPLSILFQDRTPMVLAWCRLRQGFERFEVARIGRAERSGAHFRPRRLPLLRQFLAVPQA